MNVNITMAKCNECRHFDCLNVMNLNIFMVKCNEYKHFDG